MDLDAIRTRLNAATPGPWWAWDRGVGHHIAVGAPLKDGYPAAFLPAGQRTDIERAEDAAFIAHARTDVTDLLAALEAADQRRDEAVSAALTDRTRAMQERIDLLTAGRDEARAEVERLSALLEHAEQHARDLQDELCTHPAGTVNGVCPGCGVVELDASANLEAGA